MHSKKEEKKVCVWGGGIIKKRETRKEKPLGMNKNERK